MIIACPNCKTRFVVAPASIGDEGRTVKCSKCLHTWFQAPSEEALEVVPETVIEEKVDDVTNSPKSEDKKSESEDDVRPGDEPLRKNVPALIEKNRTGQIIGWGLLVIFLAALVTAIFFFRDPLEKHILFAKDLFTKWEEIQNPPLPVDPETLPPEVILVPHPAAKLSMRQSVEIRPTDTAPTLVIFLDIQNNGNQNVELPEMMGVIRDAEGNEVFTWTQGLIPTIVPANGFQQYEIFVDTISTQSRSVEVSFNWPEDN